jgi:hypothetical protein
MDKNRYILHTQKHILHPWNLDVSHGSTTHEYAWMFPSFTHLLYVLHNIQCLNTPPPHWRNSPVWARTASLSWLHEHTQTHHTPEGRPWTSDQPDANTSTWQHTSLIRHRDPCPRRDSNTQCQQANGLRPMPYTAGPLGSAKIFKYSTYSHLVGRPVLIYVTSWPNSQFDFRTVNKDLIKSLPERLQVNAQKWSCSWFMTGHSTPSAIKMLACGNYFPASAWITETIG